MAYLPVVAFSRSMSLRLGRGAGSSVVPQLGMGDLPINVQTGALNILFYANLSDPNVRKDYQHHAAIGAIDSVGSLSTTVTSDMFAKSGIVASAGTGLAVNTTAGVLVGRTFGGAIDVAAVTGVAGTGPLAVPAASTTQPRIDAVYINASGGLAIAQGANAPTQVYEVDSVATTGAPTGGSILLTFTYNGQTFTTNPATNPISNVATAANIAAAVQAAGNLPGTLTGTGGPLGTGAVTLTASGALTGTFSNFVVTNLLTGGTNPAATYTQTTAGVQGPVAPTVGGACQVVATYSVLANATGPTSFTQVIPTS
jgi:hypothetical protein